MWLRGIYRLGIVLTLFTACADTPPPGGTAATSQVALPPGGTTTITCEEAPVCPPPPVCLPACGDLTCNGTESCSTCPGDCGVCPPVCGDKTCNGTETCATCPGDCGVCPAPATSFTFSAVGDIGTTTNSTAVLKAAPANGEFLLMLGDLSYQAPPETAWCNYVKTHIGTLRTVIVSGNHESVSTHANGLIDNFIAANCLPNTLSTTGVYGKEYYFDYPAAQPLARIIAVSPELPFENPSSVYSSKKGTAHYLWATNAIDQARAAGIKWIIIATHRPCITVGVKTCEMGTDFFNMLIEKKVDLVLMGHDHSYQRSKQLALSPACTAVVPNVFNASCVVDDGADNLYGKGKGPIFLVNGMGGRAAYAGSTTDPEVPYMASFMGASITWGLTKVTVTADKIDVSLVRTSGGTYADSFTITSAVEAPPVPLTKTFTENTLDFNNPERGWYGGLNLLSSSVFTSATALRVAGKTVAYAGVRLDAFRAGPIDAATLTGLSNGFAGARSAGVKIILRFVYNNNGTDPDAPLSVVLGHIAQLKPLLTANADVIAVWQGGFIGSWGEWHGSTNGLGTTAAQSAIINAMLGSLPANRSVQIRTPMYKNNIFPGFLTAAEAYTGTPKSRVGHHNDCFLASESDVGTYESPVSLWEDFVAKETLYTPMGGETCKVYEPRTNCTFAMAQMAKHHWSYMNSAYNQLVYNTWTSGGCFPEVGKKLGYRFSVKKVSYPASTRVGAAAALSFVVSNTGFSVPFNSRPVYVVLRSGTTKVVFPVPVDSRLWTAGADTTVDVSLVMKSGVVPPGTYSVSLWLPDAAASLQADTRYAVRFANDGMWNDTTGENVVLTDLVVAP